MKVEIITVGRIKKGYLKHGIAEFKKKLNKHVKFNFIEVNSERIPNNLSQAEQNKIKAKEAESLISKLDNRAYSLALDPSGKPMTSEGLAKSINNLKLRGYNKFQFIIGGALGLHDNLLKASDYKLSLSNMTFTHQMVRLILMEQIYRAIKINKGEPYHI